MALRLHEARAIDGEDWDGSAMHLSTMVTRTPAGNAELARPAHGLSLMQRRFLTLLDTSASVEELAARQPVDFDKLERDLIRLASLGLVTCDMPAANDPIAVPSPRLQAWRTPGWIVLALAPMALVLLGVGAWQKLSDGARPDAPASVVAPPDDATARVELPATITPIATRVLRSDPSLPAALRDSSRDAGPRSAQRVPKPSGDTASAPAAPPPD
jgi:hypothetical protein